MDSSHKGQWRGVSMFCLMCASTNGWTNSGVGGDLRRHYVHVTSLQSHFLFLDQTMSFIMADEIEWISRVTMETVPGTRLTTWWRHQMETFSALPALCAGNSPVPGEFPSQRPVTRSFDVSLICALNKRSSKQSWGWWFETPSRSLWRHCNV